MKKITIVLSSLLVLLFIVSCNSSKHLKKISNQKQIDTRLVGSWEGSEEGNQIENMTKEWKMIRTNDGKFTLHFKVTVKDYTQESTEDGNWWVSNGVFHEYHNVSGKTDKYNYEVLNNNQIKFKAISMSVVHENQEYEFIDNRVK